MKHTAQLTHVYDGPFCSLDDDSPSGTVTTSSVTKPFSPIQQEALERGIGGAEELLDRPKEFFPGSTVVPFSEQTEQSLQQREALAGNNPFLEPVANEAISTIRGDRLNQQNPAFQELINTLSGDVSSRVNSQFANSGRTGSLANQEALSRGIGQAIAPFAFGTFDKERQNQLNLLMQSPQLAAARFADADQLGAVGQARERLAGAEMQDLISRFNFAQDEPSTRLAEFMALVGGGRLGTQTEATQPIFSNKGANTAGLIASGLGSAATLFGSSGSGT